MSILNGDLDFDDIAPITIEDLNHQVCELQGLLNDSLREVQLLNQALVLIKKFCSDNNYDLTPLIGTQRKQIGEMTREELKAENQKVVEKQANKVAKSVEVAPMPTYEELQKMYEERVPKIDPVARSMMKQLEPSLKEAYFYKINALDSNALSAYTPQQYFDLSLEKIEAILKEVENKK